MPKLWRRQFAFRRGLGTARLKATRTITPSSASRLKSPNPCANGRHRRQLALLAEAEAEGIPLAQP